MSLETTLHPSHTWANSGFGVWPREFVPLEQQPSHRQKFFERICQQFASNKPLTILDIGCGNGNNIIPAIEALSPHFPKVTAILSDLAPQATQATGSTIGTLNTRVNYAVCRMSGFQLGLAPSSVDTVTCINVFHWLSQPQQKRLLLEVYRILRPGGLLMIDTVSPFNPGIVGRMTPPDLNNYETNVLGIQDGLRPPLAVNFPYTYKAMPWHVHDSYSLHAFLYRQGFTSLDVDTYRNSLYPNHLSDECVAYFSSSSTPMTHRIPRQENLYAHAQKPESNHYTHTGLGHNGSFSPFTRW